MLDPLELQEELSGGVYVTGGSRGSDLVDDFATIKYSASGVEQWSVRHSDEGDTFDIATAIGVDPSGGVYVTGSSTRLGGRLFMTIKYSEGPAAMVENEWRPRGDTLSTWTGEIRFSRKRWCGTRWARGVIWW